MKYHQAKLLEQPAVELWGTGKAMREFLFVDDLADGCIFLMKHYSGSEPVNMGAGNEISILELSKIIQKSLVIGGKLSVIPQSRMGCHAGC